MPTADGRGVGGVRARTCRPGRRRGRCCGPTSSSTPRAVAAGPPSWLEQLGYERPAETRIDAGVAYASRTYAGATPVRSSTTREGEGIFVQARPAEGARMGVMFPIEGDRWIVTLQGAGGDAPPIDDGGFVGFARSLRSPILHDAIRFAEPLTPAVAFANTANRRRHFERLRRWPDGFVVVGDGVCAFNPIYGQGMTVAAQTAVELGAPARRPPASSRRPFAGFAQRMQRRVARCGDAAWMIATGDDLRLPTTTGATAGAATRVQHRYLDRVMTAATNDEVVAGGADRRLLPRRPADVAVPTVDRRSCAAPLRGAVHGGADVVAGSGRRLTALLRTRRGRGSPPAGHRAPGTGRGRGAARASPVHAHSTASSRSSRCFTARVGERRRLGRRRCAVDRVRPDVDRRVGGAQRVDPGDELVAVRRPQRRGTPSGVRCRGLRL